MHVSLGLLFHQAGLVTYLRDEISSIFFKEVLISFCLDEQNKVAVRILTET